MNLNTKVSKILLMLVYSTIIYASCSTDTENSISKEGFSSVLTELITIESMNISDTLKVRLIQKHLKEKKVTVQIITNLIERKKSDSAYWQNIYEKVQLRLKNNEASD